MVEEPAVPAARRPAARSAARSAADAVDVDEIVRFALALIAAPSENPGGTEERAATVAAELLAELEADPRIVRGDAGRPSVVARIGNGRPRLAWNGHLDVVPAGDPSTWERPPFAADLADGRIVGRGAADMKGAIAGGLAAAAAIRRAGVELGGTLEFHLVADEELAGHHGTKVLLDHGLLDQDACIVGEPTELRLGLAQRGSAWITAVARGRSAHGSTPELGVNAITSMARVLLRLPEVLPDRAHPLVGRPSVNASIVTGGTAPNVVPDRCELDIDRRVVPGEDSPEEVLEPFRRLVREIRAEHPEVEVEFRLREWTESAEAAGDSAIAAACRLALHEETGSAPSDHGLSGITDARYYLNHARIPTVILGPGSLSVAHTANEWVDVEELVTAARAYARTFVAFLDGS